ncbi:MAG: 3'-5' exoribonuclease YhaM family protein [Solirubrobacterales bacterium]
MATENISIADLIPDSEVEGVYACTKKEKLTARSGSPYLSVELRDASGKIGARAFRDASFLADQFDRGDIVHVAGRVESFKDERQINLRSIKRTEENAAVDPRDFLPSAYRDVDELEGFFEHLTREIADPGLRGIAEGVLADSELREGLRTAPCTTGGHHPYLGGLLEHTVAVATLAQQTWDLHRKLDSDLLICASLLHDIGKVQEFDYGAVITVSEAGRQLGHLQLGADIVRDLASRVAGIEPARLNDLLACILSHHGPPPGSQRMPSAEAVALQRINTLDANVKGILEKGVHQQESS